MNQSQTRSPRKRWLSLILAVVLMIGLLPISAFASNTGAQADDSGSAAESQFLRIFHLDCGRKYFSVSEIKGIIDQLAANHYTHIQLAFGNDGLRFLLDDMSVTVNGTEYKSDAVKTAIQNGNSGNGLAGADAGVLTQDDMDTIIAYANKAGIEVIPMFNAPGHMYTAIKAMNSLSIGGKYSGTDTSRPSKALNWSIDPTDSTSVAYAEALLTKYVKYFAEKECTMFNIGADESGLSSSNYAAYAEMVNAMNEIVKSEGMTTLAYNDGIYNTKYASSQSNVTFDDDIIICYWTTGDGIASAKSLSDKGFKILNNTNNWYYVLGDGLYRSDVWGDDGQWGYESAVNGLKSTKVTQVKGDEDTNAVTPVGSVLCCWCDVPSIGYTDNGVKTNQSNKESVYSLIKTMAESNPDYFKEYQPEVKVDTASAQGVTVSAAGDGNYQVILPETTGGKTMTVQLSLINPPAEHITWTSDKEDVATVNENGLVTFTGTPGIVTITATPQSPTNAGEEATYSVTFEVKAAGELTVKEITVQEGRTHTVTLNGDLTSAVSGLSNEYVEVKAAYTQTAEMELQAVTEITSGEQYLIVNQRKGTLLTNEQDSSWEASYSGLKLSGKAATDSEALWTITTSRSSGYTVQDTSSKYLNIGTSSTSVGTSSQTLTLSYSTTGGIDGTTGGYWNISNSDSYYLNHLGDSTCAGGWKDSKAPTDAGSKWTIYRIADKSASNTTTVTFKGLQVGTTSVIIGDTTYRITVTEKKTVEIPISIVDYRADGLLFDYSYLNDSDSYRYDLIHGKRSDSGSTTSVAATKDSTTGLYTVDGENDITSGSTTYLQGIAGTKIEQTGTPNAIYNHNFGTGWGDNSWSRAGLVETKLGTNGMPEYTEAAVQYVAGLMNAGYYNDVSDSAYNCNSYIYKTFVAADGERTIHNTSTTEFSAQFEVTKSYANISNAYDLAWYLLNTIYQPDTEATVNVTGTDGQKHDVPLYGMAVDTYKSIVLTADGNKYTFEAGYSNNPKNVLYDKGNGTISNDGETSVTGFYPLDGLGYEQNGLLEKTSKIDASHNGSFTLRGESQFVYNSADDLYFTFTGDDDVYMYINGVLALDLGGAHGRNTKTVKLNSLDKDTYHLKDGEVATFTFFYMERCSDASTFGIETNMELVQRDIAVEKNAYSDSGYKTPVASGAVVDNGRSLYYDLVVTNLGNTTMTNFTFEDTDTFTGKANLGYDVTKASVTAGSGQVSLSANGYTYFVTDADGNQVGETKTCDSLEALSTAVAGVELAAKQSLHVRFLKATVDVAPSKIISYTNTIKVTASAGGARLWGDGSHSIYAYNDGGTARTYVVDFGLPLKIEKIFDPSAESYINGTITLNGQPKYGTAELTAAGYDSSVVYRLNAHTTIDGQDTITLNVPYKFENAERTLPKTLNIIPASNVYYEDSLASFTNGSGVAEDAKWSTVNNENETVTEDGGTDVYQALQELGSKKIYGYDTAYNSSSMLSMGTAHKVTVTSDMLKNWTTDDTKSAWPTASFTFTGTGFDVISLTDNTSGAILVKVTGAGADNKDFSKNYLVNNYYGYKQEENEDGSISWVVSESDDSNALYQIPVMKVDVPYGAYNVKIQVFYNQIFDKTGDRQYNFWLDAIRVYNPMGEDYDYTADDEGYPQYIKLHDALVDGTATPDGEAEDKMVFIDGAENATIEQYANYGPNNEVYLAKGQAISFKLTGNTNEIASIQIGAKAPKGTATMTVEGVSAATKLEKTLETATEMYYDITEQAKGGRLVTITNTSGSILSLTNLKITYTKADQKVTLRNLTAEDQTSAVAMVQALFAAPVETFSPETFQADWGRAVRAGKQATLTVKTSEDVDAITVDGVTVSSYTTRTERTGWGWWSPKVTYRVFTYTTTATATADYQVCAVSSTGIASEPITATLTVRPATWWNWWF